MRPLLPTDNLIFGQQFLEAVLPVALLLQGDAHELESGIVLDVSCEKAEATALLAHHAPLHLLCYNIP